MNMNMNKKAALASLLALGSIAAFANQQPTSNANPAYSQSNVQAQLRLNIKEGADVVHFIRDTNDPKIITKTYVLKHADPYSIRPYLREMVQATRVNYNNAAGRENSAYYNVYNKTSNGETLYVPTGIECVKFVDGTGIIMVSAEDYRFESSPNGMGIDEMVAALDAPGVMNSSGQPKYIYFPKNRSASELRSMVRLVGANVSNDLSELIGGKDKIEVDEELNCLFLNTALYSRKNIEDMLKIYDIAQPEVRISCKVYELDAENDGMLGLDFQSWKNNNGYRLLQTGANLTHNSNLSGFIYDFVDPNRTVNTNYFNLQPKWNTKFLDFLVSKGKAKVLSTGDLTVKNGDTGTLERVSGLLYAELTKIEPQPGENAQQGQHGNAVNVKAENERFRFTLGLTPSITKNATTLSISAQTLSMLGYTSTGAIRTSSYSTNQKFMLGNGKNRFYLGGIEKTQVVRDVGGIPLLKDIPVLGWIFSTERESTKKSTIVVVADCEVVAPNTKLSEDEIKNIELIRNTTDKADGEFNSYGYRQFLLDPER